TRDRACKPPASATRRPAPRQARPRVSRWTAASFPPYSSLIAVTPPQLHHTRAYVHVRAACSTHQLRYAGAAAVQWCTMMATSVTVRRCVNGKTQERQGYSESLACMGERQSDVWRTRART